MLAWKYLLKAITHRSLRSWKSILHSPRNQGTFKRFPMTFQSRENTSSRLPIEGLEICIAFLAPWTKALEENNQVIGMVGDKAS